ncbi:MAG: NAD(P)H-hydrate epimerase [Actinomycetota bacterium]
MAHSTVHESALAWISADDMREIDRVMIDELHVDVVQMMENAGRALAEVVTLVGPSSVAVLVGTGGNGGGGLVAARHLANIGLEVRVVLARPPTALAPVPTHQLDIVRRLGIPTIDDTAAVDAVAAADVVVDALVGYSLRGSLRGTAAELVDAIPASARVVSLDVPSGLDATTGRVDGVVVRPDATVTLCLPKSGLRDPASTGELFLADISVPPSVTERVGAAPAPPFVRGRVLRITGR